MVQRSPAFKWFLAGGGTVRYPVHGHAAQVSPVDASPRLPSRINVTAVGHWMLEIPMGSLCYASHAEFFGRLNGIAWTLTLVCVRFIGTHLPVRLLRGDGTDAVRCAATCLEALPDATPDRPICNRLDPRRRGFRQTWILRMEHRLRRQHAVPLHHLLQAGLLGQEERVRLIFPTYKNRLLPLPYCVVVRH